MKRNFLLGSLFIGFLCLAIGQPNKAYGLEEATITSNSSIEEKIEGETKENKIRPQSSEIDEQPTDVEKRTEETFDSKQDREKAIPDGYSEKQYDESKEKALRAGYSEEQFEAIIRIPKLESAPVIESRAAMTNDQQKVVNMAKAQLGKPYQWGADGPGSFDCGGLVRYVYRNSVGIDIPMGTEVQRNYGKSVSMSNLLPGDLLFWLADGTNTTTHVAIYIGNGQFIHSPQENEVVTTVNMSYLNPNSWYPKFARRILPEAPPQGPWIEDGRYATIMSKGYTMYSNFDWSKKDSTDNHFNKTYQALGRYEHSNGKTYYSLYDSSGTWKGYLDSKACKMANGPEGAWINDGRYVTITKRGELLYNDFKWTKKDSTDNHYEKTYQALGRYNHTNGKTYYSLYKSGVWQGYIEADSCKVSNGPEGAWIYDGRYMTIMKDNRSI